MFIKKLNDDQLKKAKVQVRELMTSHGCNAWNCPPEQRQFRLAILRDTCYVAYTMAMYREIVAVWNGLQCMPDSLHQCEALDDLHFLVDECVEIEKHLREIRRRIANGDLLDDSAAPVA